MSAWGWVWIITIVMWLALWWYRSLVRAVRFKHWQYETFAWLPVQPERPWVDPEWEPAQQ